ncbi:hypothetical protein SPRG_09722 [Saprolegnia parasitica CBS 223.65]|uniref:Uncharacterized protein n=1 Tax=Saprolegnia parasitica (strain CBS 223.65) TaxID=695850 RepID=A0A067CDT9_SAPPC|nr:hypothetical protein SPRG_09722 [Saprolegnia parasitica CBS 223.65]KDO24992.1 hypothetical protein SPRG_09722 [Saprolegnia parasitica CBS 223.65]|eukprot:XP_012204261.1 hypothetical protein SPRG_09722 [Saprolegnia parasitica CBS 223.65]
MGYLDCAPIDVAKAPYEDALDYLPRDACATYEYAYVGSLDDAMAPSLSVLGFTSSRKWSQDTRVVDAILGLHPSGIVPTTMLQLDARDGLVPPTAWANALPRRLDATLRDHFVWGSAPLTPVLSHVMIHGPASATARLEPITRAPASVGTLLLTFPSYVEGGALSVAFEAATTTSVCSDCLSSTFAIAVAHRAATIAMAPISAGHAVVAVFDLVGGAAPSSPISEGVRAAIAALVAVGAKPPRTYPLVGYGIRPQFAFTTFQDLPSGSRDRAFAHALIASEMYDVAIVHYTDDGDAPFVIAQATMHPSSRLPSECALALRGRSVPAFLHTVNVGDLRRSGDHRRTSLVFWHKAHRPYVLGLPVALDVFATTSATIATRRCLVDAMLGYLEQAARERNATTRYNSSAKTWACTAALGHLVLAVGDVRLVEELWEPLDFFVAPTHLALMAPSMHATIQRFGTYALFPLLEYILRWWTTRWSSFAVGCQLLASFAGVSVAPLCLPLSIPGARASIVSAYAVLMDLTLVERNPTNSTRASLAAIICDGSRLAAYVKDEKHRLQTLVQSQPALFHPQTVLAPALETLLPNRLLWCETLLLATVHVAPMDATPSNLMTVPDATCVLRVLHSIHALDAPMLQALVTLWGALALDTIAMFLAALEEDVLVGLETSVLAVVTTTTLEAIQNNLAKETASWRAMAKSTARVLLSAQLTSSSAATMTFDVFLASIVGAVGDVMALHEAFVWPLLQDATAIGLSLRGQKTLAFAMLRVLPTYKTEDELPLLTSDMAITDVVLEPCCRACRRFEAFLRSSTRAQWALAWYAESPTTLCDKLAAMAQLLATRLSCSIDHHATYLNVRVATFVKRHAMVLEARHHEVERQQRTRTLVMLLGDEHDKRKMTSHDQGDEAAMPAAKRQKLSTCS